MKAATACTALGKAFEVLPARVHQGNHDAGEVFGKNESREHRERGNDIQADIAATQTDNDLRQESDQDRNRSRSPYWPNASIRKTAPRGR